jgi:hypothetical protein
MALLEYNLLLMRKNKVWMENLCQHHVYMQDCRVAYPTEYRVANSQSTFVLAHCSKMANSIGIPIADVGKIIVQNWKNSPDFRTKNDPTFDPIGVAPCSPEIFQNSDAGSGRI